MNEIKAVIFYIDNIISRTNERLTFEEYFEDEADVQKFIKVAFKKFPHPELNADADANTDSAPSPLNRFWDPKTPPIPFDWFSKEYPEYKDAYKYYYDNHNEMAVTAISGMPELITELKARNIKVIILSNFRDGCFLRATNILSFLNMPITELISTAKEREKQTIHDAIREILSELNIKNSETIIFGEKLDDLQMAITAGFQVSIFKDSAQTTKLALRISDVKQDKMKASFLLGACGDALGAPLEGMRDLKDIIKQHGENGLSEIIPYENQFEKGSNYPAGRITDDTTMCMTTAIALIMILKEKHLTSADFIKNLNHLTWQGYLNWGQHQHDTSYISDKIDTSIQWPENIRHFWFTCGAGRGTIAALLQEEPGSIEEPLDYTCEIRGKKITAPNYGCGGMMRIAPLAFISTASAKDIFTYACHNAALTHGAQDAYVSSAIIALYIYYASQNRTPIEVIERTNDFLINYNNHPDYEEGVENALQAMITACNSFQEKPFSFFEIDSLPKKTGHTNAFHAIPVLAQVTYAFLHADEIKQVKKAIVLGANHSGDSDSVAAILGNILGAMYGRGCIPKEWLDTLIQKDGINEIAEQLIDVQDDSPLMYKKPIDTEDKIT